MLSESISVRRCFKTAARTTKGGAPFDETLHKVSHQEKTILDNNMQGVDVANVIVMLDSAGVTTIGEMREHTHGTSTPKETQK